jgi:hypothetical protein
MRFAYLAHRSGSLAQRSIRHAYDENTLLILDTCQRLPERMFGICLEMQLEGPRRTRAALYCE